MRGDHRRRPPGRLVIEAREGIRSRALAHRLEPAKDVGLRTDRSTMGCAQGQSPRHA
jgi:hypothetical protein